MPITAGITCSVTLMGLYWFRQREEVDAYDWGKRNPAFWQSQAKKVTANAFASSSVAAIVAIARAAASSKVAANDGAIALAA